MNLKEKYSVGAVILAAGQSKRMGRNKMLLPFDRSTVIATIVSEVTSASVSEAVVVTGYEADKIEAALKAYPVRCVFNPDYAQAEMLVSMQMGLRSMSEHPQAVLMVLGDQPRIRREVVQRVIGAGEPGALMPVFGRRLVFREAGFPVIGFDSDQKKVAALNAGESYIKHIGAERVAAAPGQVGHLAGRLLARHRPAGTLRPLPHHGGSVLAERAGRRAAHLPEIDRLTHAGIILDGLPIGW